MGNRVVVVTAGGEFLAEGAAGKIKTLGGARVVAAAATATLIVKETDTNGRVLAHLSAAADTADETAIPVSYTGKIFVTVTGSGAAAYVFEP